MGGQQTAEPPNTTKTEEEYGSTGPRLRQSDGADGARFEHGALARREYNLLSLEATKGGPTNAGDGSSKDGHGALANGEGKDMEEEGDKTPQRALPAQESNGGETKARGPPEWSRALNACGRQGGEGGMDTPPRSARLQRAAGAQGGPTNTASQDPST